MEKLFFEGGKLSSGVFCNFVNECCIASDDDNNNNNDARSIVDKVYLHIHKLLQLFSLLFC